MENKLKNKLYPLIEKIKSDKKMLFIILIGISGMLLIVFSEFTDKADEEKAPVNENCIFSEEEQKEELEELIGKISGVGRVEVMITYECSQESIFARNLSEQNNEDSSKLTNEYIIIDSGNEEEGMLLKEVYPKVMGVAVVCDGGNNPTVKTEITMMIKAIFNISSNNISISQMQNQEE